MLRQQAQHVAQVVDTTGAGKPDRNLPFESPCCKLPSWLCATCSAECALLHPWAMPAGDCFTAAFAVALLEGRPHQEAMRFASAAAALCIQVRAVHAAAQALSPAFGPHALCPNFAALGGGLV